LAADSSIHITKKQKLALWDLSVAEKMATSKRVYNKYQANDPKAPKWDELHPNIQTIVVDLIYRGAFGCKD
jgi:hypothetical protein